jgi:branched-chain amino acid aminotransferase
MYGSDVDASRAHAGGIAPGFESPYHPRLAARAARGVRSVEHFVSIDGKAVPLEEATVSVFDHGFLFGDSIYEVVRTVGRKLFAFEQHVDRLIRSAEGICLEMPCTPAELRAIVEREIARVEGAGEVYVRIMITRGEGLLDLSPESCRAPRIITIAKPLMVWPRAWYEEGIELRVVERMRNPRRAVSPAIKSGNYLNNVLALIEAKRSRADDAVMLNEHGFLTECTTSNVFFVRDGVLETPALECGILVGVTRAIVLDVARKAGIVAREGHFTIDDLHRAEEAFITSTTKDLVPVRAIDDVRVKAPGPLTRRLSDLFRTRVREMQGSPT